MSLAELYEDDDVVDDDDEPGITDDLTDEECYFAAIVMDESGLDFAEFAFVDETRSKPGEHFIFRAYPFQWTWWRAKEDQRIDQCCRSCGKSESILCRSSVFALNHPGQEAVLITPEGKHADSITDRIEARFKSCWLLTQLLKPGRTGITHRSFKMFFQNGTRWYVRLPGRLGTGARGVHPVILEVDEGQDISDRTYMELPEVVRWEVEGAKWLIHGVSKGIQDTFWRYTQAGSGFAVYQITALDDPNFDEDRRKQKEIDYGGKDSPDFKRNFYGMHGDAMNRIFVLARLAAAIAEAGSPYTTEDYFKAEITAEEIEANANVRARSAHDISEATDHQVAAMIAMLDFPRRHERYEVTWAGMDIGLVGDPSEILVAAEYVPSGEQRRADRAAVVSLPEAGISRLQVIARIKVSRVPEPLLVELVKWVINFYRPKAFSLDKTGQGLPIFQALQAEAGTSRLLAVEPDADATAAERAAFTARREQAGTALTIVKGYNFSEKILIDFDEAKVAELGPNASMELMIEKAGIRQNVRDRATDVARSYVDHRRILLPDDSEIRNDLNAQTWSYSSEPVDAYGKRRYAYSHGTFHILDGFRMLVLGHSQQRIEQVTAKQKRRPVLDYFG